MLSRDSKRLGLLFFFSVDCSVWGSGKTGNRTQLNIFMSHLQTLLAPGTRLPCLSLLHVRLTDPWALSHRDRRQPSLFAIVSSPCPISLLKNQPPFRSCGPIFVGESVFGIITRILHPGFHSNVLMHTPSYISIQNCAVDQILLPLLRINPLQCKRSYEQ